MKSRKGHDYYTLHCDGTVTYWSVYRQQWNRRATAWAVDNGNHDGTGFFELDRNRIERHWADNAKVNHD